MSTAAALILLATLGCVTAPDSPQGESNDDSLEPPDISSPGTNGETNEALASSTVTATDIGSELQIDIHALERLENNLLRLQIGITNNSPDGFDVGFGLAEDGDLLSASFISLIDEENQQLYISYDQSDGSCFCDALDGPIGSGETETLWVIYPDPPPDLESMTVTTPLTPPLFDIPISNSSESVENDNLEDPEIRDLTMISDDLDDQTGRTESGEEVSILLSADVLFETNSSDLSDESQEILEQVTQEIDDTSPTTVSVEGHADDTGTDEINLPLSQERAESVESAVSELISREDVTFEVEGHGSAEPIADNSTEEGRERNRRVSVTFEV